MTHSNFRNGIIIQRFLRTPKQLLSSKQWFGLFDFDHSYLYNVKNIAFRAFARRSNDISYFLVKDHMTPVTFNCKRATSQNETSRKWWNTHQPSPLEFNRWLFLFVGYLLIDGFIWPKFTIWSISLIVSSSEWHNKLAASRSKLRFLPSVFSPLFSYIGDIHCVWGRILSNTP